MTDKMLFTPMNIGSCEIKNRIVMAPMLMGFGQFDGKTTEKMLNYYEERAKGGTGLIITEITRIDDKTGSAAFAQLSASTDENIFSLSELAQRIHKHNAKIFVQLHHPGRQNIGLLVGTVPLSMQLEKLTKGLYGKLLYKLTPALGPTLIEKNVAPASVAPSACEPAYFAGGKVRALTIEEIKELEQEFIAGAVRVQKSGIDGVELHASHGYLLQQFFSPVTNQRTDEYGGSFENRMRFITNIINGIREKCGRDFPLIVRLTVDECYDRIGQPDKGYKLEEGVKIAKALEELSVDAIDVSSAGYDTFNYWLEPSSFEPGWRKYMAKAVKDAVSIPVIAANLIRSPEQAEAQLQEGTQDFVSLGRPHIADPHWARKAENGETIRRCVCCLNCIETMQTNAYSGSHGECAVNPFVGHEGTELKKDGAGRRVVICGAGPAGLMTADILAQRGFDVTVFEKDAQPGGQINLAKMPPKKDKIDWFTQDLYKMALDHGAKFIFNTEATVEKIADIHPYAVFCAVGSAAFKPFFGGKYTYEDLLTFEDILSGKVKLTDKNVAVIGSGFTGLETAEFLNEEGNRTTIIEMASSVAPGAWMQHIDDMLPRLEAAGTVIRTNEALCEIYKDKIVSKNTKTGEKTEMPVDAVVLALGSKSCSELWENLQKTNWRVFKIGDADHPGNLANATKSAYNAAVALK